MQEACNDILLKELIEHVIFEVNEKMFNGLLYFENQYNDQYNNKISPRII